MGLGIDVNKLMPRLGEVVKKIVMESIEDIGVDERLRAMKEELKAELVGEILEMLAEAGLPITLPEPPEPPAEIPGPEAAGSVE